MFHFQFHWYGFFIGLALISGLYLTEYLLKKRKIPTTFFWNLVTFVIIGGLIGSRAWHVATDFQIYAGDLWKVFAIWNGGLSIIGTIFGAAIGFLFFFKLFPEWKKYQLETVDVTVFGLALGQAIGRLGNYVNQELYGLPSKLPWSIFIDPEHRLPGFEQYSTFHPLFAYEAILLLVFILIAWRLQPYFVKKGNGVLFAFYIFYYSWIRFGLDFLRIDKAASPTLGLGVNQIVLLFVGFCTLLYLFITLWRKHE